MASAGFELVGSSPGLCPEEIFYVQNLRIEEKVVEMS